MIISPEFHRQLWRVNLWAVILGLIITAFLFYGPLSLVWGGKQDVHPAVLLTVASVNLFGFIAIIVTGWCAGMSFTEDVKDGTWDFQRMSSINPWDMALGRYLGVTAVWWIVGFVILAFGLACYVWMIYEGTQPDVPIVYMYTIPRVIFGLLTAVLLSFVAYYVGMQEIAVMRDSEITRSGGGMGILPVIVYGLVAIETNDGGAAGPFSFILMPDVMSVEWWGHAFDGYAFFVYSIVFFIFWMIAAIYRQAKAELQFRCTAVVWSAFNICLAIYVAGFFSGVWAGLTGMLTLAALSIVGIASLSSPSYEARMIAAWRGGEWRRIFENMPGGICSLLMALVAYVVFMGYALITGQAGQSWAGYSVATFAGTGILLVLRDYLFLSALRKGSLGKKFKEVTLTSYFIGLYGVLPLISIIVSDRIAEDRDAVNGLVSILIHVGMAWPMMILLSQVMAAALVFIYAIRQRRRAA